MVKVKIYILGINFQISCRLIIKISQKIQITDKKKRIIIFIYYIGCFKFILSLKILKKICFINERRDHVKIHYLKQFNNILITLMILLIEKKKMNP